MKLMPRGMRNNNPLNIEHSRANPWRGLAEPPTDGRFARFVTMELGVRAAAVTLRTYQNRHKLDTVEKIIRRWAPPIENDVKAYIASVNKHANFNADQKLDLTNADVLVRLIRAMARHECGVELDEKIARLGVSLAP